MTLTVARRNVFVRRTLEQRSPGDDKTFSSHYCVISRKLVLIANVRLWIIDEITLWATSTTFGRLSTKKSSTVGRSRFSDPITTALCASRIISALINYTFATRSTAFALAFRQQKASHDITIPIAPINFQGSIMFGVLVALLAAQLTRSC